MVKIRNWKKISDWRWNNTFDPEKFVIITDMGAHRYIVQNQDGFNSEGLIAIESSKVKAIKRATDYMFSHPEGKKSRNEMEIEDVNNLHDDTEILVTDIGQENIYFQIKGASFDSYVKVFHYTKDFKVPQLINAKRLKELMPRV